MLFAWEDFNQGSSNLEPKEGTAVETEWMKTRARLIQEAEELNLQLAELNSQHDEVNMQVLDLDEAEAEKLELELDQIEDTIAEKTEALARIEDSYRQKLPVKALSRCPFSGELLYRSIDLSGLEGFYWCYERPVRKDEELLPTFFAMDGALKTAEPLEHFKHTVCIGPEAPFVLPRLLQYEEIRAVISSFPLGGHRLFLICYFADPFPHNLRRVNDLGSFFYRYSNSAGLTRNDFFEDSGKDFELEPWIAAGRLQWISENDPALSLRSHLNDCPYLNLPGNRATLAINSGAIEETEPLQWMAGEELFLPEDDLLSPEEQEALFASDEETVYEELDLDELEKRLEEDRLFYEAPITDGVEE